jgi:sugar lactone lactonase YvrE
MFVRTLLTLLFLTVATQSWGSPIVPIYESRASGGGIVVKLDSSTGSVIRTFFPGVTRAYGAAIDGDGRVYITSESDEIVTYAPDGTFEGILTTGDDARLYRDPRDLVIGPDGNLYSGTSAGGVWSFDPITGAVLNSNFAAGTSGNSWGLTFGSDDFLYVTDTANDSIIKYDIASRRNSVFVSSRSGGLDHPTGLEFGPDGNLYVISRGQTGDVLRYNGTTGAFIDTFINEQIDVAFDLAFGPNNFVYVSDLGGLTGSRVQRHDATTGAFVDILAPSQSASYLAFEPESTVATTMSEPSTWMLFVPGIAALGWLHQRSSQARARDASKTS